jgi:VWFA-related protein
MRSRSLLYSLTLLIVVNSFYAQPSTAQSTIEEKPKLKDFGSSLKRLKWDARRNLAVENEHQENNGKSGDEEDVVRVETTLVISDLLVLDDRGRPVEGLSANAFEVSEDGTPQKLAVFTRGDSLDLPRSIVLIIDYSHSQFPYLKTSIDAAKTLVDKLNPQDRMAIVTDDVELLVDFSGDKTLLKSKLDLLIRRTRNYPGALTEIFGRRQPRFGRSAQYSALMATLKEAFAEDLHPIIVFQTDGDEAFNLRNPIVVHSIPPNLPDEFLEQERKSLQQRRREVEQNRVEFSLEDVYRAAERSRATIYTIIPGFRFVGLTSAEQLERVKAEYRETSLAWSTTLSGRFKARAREQMEERLKKTPDAAWRYEATQNLKVQSALAEVAPLSGGSTEFLEDPSQAQEIYSRILLDINRRYLLGYYPLNKKHDGKRRKIRVAVRNHPDYQVIGRRSYFAPGTEQ